MWNFHRNNNNHNRSTALCPGLPGWAGTRRNTHPPTILIIYHAIFISFFHLRRSIASSFKLRAWQSFCTTSFHVLFGLPLGLEASTSYSIHFFTQSVSSFRSTCPYHRNLFCCTSNIISSIPSLSLNSLLGTLSFTLTLHIHLTILISAVQPAEAHGVNNLPEVVTRQCRGWELNSWPLSRKSNTLTTTLLTTEPPL